MSERAQPSQDAFLSQVVRDRSVRVSVRSICVHDDAILAQRPADDPDACYAFVGGALEHGELMEERLRAEYLEELGAEVDVLSYLFVVENRFHFEGGLIHSLEHYYEVALRQREVASREPHLSFHWIRLAEIHGIDLRPHVVAGALADGTWRERRHFAVPLGA